MVDLILVNSMGQIKYTTQGNSVENSLSISTTDLPSGIYFLQLRQGKEIIAIEKVMKLAE